jgi:hypothetical protein
MLKKEEKSEYAIQLMEKQKLNILWNFKAIQRFIQKKHQLLKEL